MGKKYNIGISCIGSGVGQSVIDSCNLSSLPIKTFGFGTNPYAFGLYNCDEYYYTPSIYDDNYLEAVFKNCKEHNIHLWIPGIDDEVHLISKNQSKFKKNNIEVIVSDEKILELCRDKKKMSDQLNKVNNIFVKSFSKSEFLDSYNNNQVKLPVISKPKDGFASRGIEIITDESDFIKLKETHIIQELAVPHKSSKDRAHYDKQIAKKINPQVAEISIQILASKEGEIVGKMASINKLNSGVPIEIVPYYNQKVWTEIDKIIPTLKKIGLKGPLNLQGRVTDKGLKIFEINARFTGITGLRASMGFNEVAFCITDWLNINNQCHNLKINPRKFGVRQTQDKSISLEYNKEVLQDFTTINNSLSSKKTLLITGATGYLGRNLIKELLISKKDDYTIWAYVRNKPKAKGLLPVNQVKLFDYDDLVSNNLSLGNVDTLLHAGFARSNRSNSEIADSISFTNTLFLKAVKHNTPEIINISTQGVYGQTKTPWREDSTIAPNTIYATAKYSTETFLNNLCKIHTHIKHTNIRLEAVSGGTDGFDENDLLGKFVKKAMKSETIILHGGNQKMVRIDIRDAVNGLVHLLSTNSNSWKREYNLGNGVSISLKDICDKVVSLSKGYINNSTSKIEIIDSKNYMEFQMDVNQFKTDMKWKPRYDLDKTLISIFDFFKN